MKILKRALCITLALVMCFSAFVLPTSAATPFSATIDVVEQPYEGVSNKGDKLHKFTAYIDASHSLVNFELSISFDKSAFYAVNAETKAFLPAPAASAMDLADTNIIFNKNCPRYLENPYCSDGFYMNDGVHPDTGYAWYASDTPAELSKMANDALGGTLMTTHQGLYLEYQTKWTDNFLIPSGGKESSVESPLRGRVAVLTFYLAEKPTATPGEYTVGINPTQVNTFSGGYSKNDFIDSLQAVGQEDNTSITSGVTYNSATVKVGSSEPVIEHVGDQVRFHANAANTGYNGTFDFRCLAAIDKASLEDYLGNVSVDKMEEMIVDAGVVYKTGAKDAFDTTAAQAKIAAHVTDKATKSIGDGYVVKSVRYLSTGYNASYYTFNCTVEDINEVEVNGVGGYSSYAYIAFDEDGNGSADKFIYSNVESHDFTNNGFVSKREAFESKFNA